MGVRELGDALLQQPTAQHPAPHRGRFGCQRRRVERARELDPAAQEHMSSATALATSDPKLYTVAATHHA